MGLSIGGKYPSKLKVWDIKSYEKYSAINLTSSKKWQDGNFVKDFGMYCRFIGDSHKKAKILKQGDMITPKSIDVSVVWNKEKGCNDVNVIIWDFALIDKEGNITEITDEMANGQASAPVNDGFMQIPDGFEANLPFK